MDEITFKLKPEELTAVEHVLRNTLDCGRVVRSSHVVCAIYSPAQLAATRAVHQKLRASAQANKLVWICPRCGAEVDGAPALSRRDNRTGICPPCGADEAYLDSEIRKQPVRPLLPTWPWQDG